MARLGLRDRPRGLNHFFHSRHPGEGRGPGHQTLRVQLWIPAFAGMTKQRVSTWLKY
jgi:hypothetical protein